MFRSLMRSHGSTFRAGLPGALPALLLATLIAYAPVMWYGYPATGWDARYHAITARMFSDQLWSGDLYPRWLMAMNSGLGSPHFFFYSPLSFYIASAFDWFGAPTAVPQLGAAAILFGFMSGITCYLWLSRLMPHAAALIGATFYLASPFHVFVDLYVRADYAEFAAMTITPVVLLGVELVRERRNAGILVIGMGFAAVVLTHVVVGLLFAGVPILYVLARSGWRPGWLLDTLLVLFASLLGLGLSGFYLVPALAFRPEVIMPVVTMTADKFIFGGAPKPMLILFIWVMFFGYSTLLAGLAAWWLCISSVRPSNLVITCFGIAVLTLALTLIWARPLWLMLPMLSTLQFSYRLFVIVDLCVAALVGSFIVTMVSRPLFSRIIGVSRFAILGMAVCGAAAAVYFGLFDYDASLWRQRVRYANDYGLFRPKTVRTALLADSLPLYSGGVFGPDIPLPPKAEIVEGQAKVEIIQWRPRHIILHIVARTPARIVLGQLYVPGWQAIDDASHEPLWVGSSDERGRLAVSLAAGTRQVDISLTPRLPEQVGVALSLLSLGGLIALTAAIGRRWARARAVTE